MQNSFYHQFFKYCEKNIGLFSIALSISIDFPFFIQIRCIFGLYLNIFKISDKHKVIKKHKLFFFILGTRVVQGREASPIPHGAVNIPQDKLAKYAGKSNIVSGFSIFFSKNIKLYSIKCKYVSKIKLFVGHNIYQYFLYTRKL